MTVEDADKFVKGYVEKEKARFQKLNCSSAGLKEA
jgi:hypothetical protein